MTSRGWRRHAFTVLQKKSDGSVPGNHSHAMSAARLTPKGEMPDTALGDTPCDTASGDTDISINVRQDPAGRHLRSSSV
jgi:hypothetical protein